MEAEIIKSLASNFESHGYLHEGIECWDARNLMVLLGYSRWDNFLNAIGKAKIACEKSGFSVEDQFRDITKMIEAGKGATRDIQDFRLTRYACYLIAQNGDPTKQEVSFAMSYFAVQTRKFEILEKRINQLERIGARGKLKETESRFSGVLFERGVDGPGIAAIRNHGDYELFGGNTTNDMKTRLGVKTKEPLADFLPTITIKAKDFATEITTFKVKENQTISGKSAIESEHVKNNRQIRRVLTDQGIFPENLPADEDIKKVDREIRSDGRRLEKSAKKRITSNRSGTPS